MKEYLKKLCNENPSIKKIIGSALILIGIIAFLTPFTPGSWLFFVGLELLGFHFVLWDRIKQKLEKIRNAIKKTHT
jgi:hypothetical protein